MSAPRELVIEVTAEDIRLGVPCNMRLCPVALAAARALGDYAGVVRVEEDAEEDAAFQVGLYLKLHDLEPDAAYPLPAVAANFVRRFDDAGEVGPLTFTVRERLS